VHYFIDVILPIPLEKRFTYSITKAESAFLKTGMRVSVPFGKTKIYTAIVGAIHNNAPQIYEAKEIHQILDDQPIVTQNQLQLWQWVAKYYMCSEGEVMRAALPQDVSNILDKKNVLPVLKRLIDKEAIVLNQEVYDKYKPKYVRYVKLHTNFSSEVALQQLLDDLIRAKCLKLQNSLMNFRIKP